MAVIWAAFFNFVAAFTVGTAVAKAISKGLIHPVVVDVTVIFAGLVGAIVWNLITWWLGLPTSSSHALLGGYGGAAVAKAGIGALIGAGWVKPIAFIVVSPAIGMTAALVLTIVLGWRTHRLPAAPVERFFRRLQLASAALFWEDLPEGYCRGYESYDCQEGPLGRDFFGGDLQGVEDKLDYLADLRVTAIYFNPIFQAPSNHLYDTTDYFRIDPYFGSMSTFQSLINAAEARGIHIILDGVFNHTSSDSIYFDRFSRYPKNGAYESQSSPFYDWFTFYNWPDEYNSWWGFTSLPVLTEIQEVRDYIFGPH